jgi:hypothetical protein
MARLAHWWLMHPQNVAIKGQAMLQTGPIGTGTGSVTATQIDVQLQPPCMREVQSESWLQ